MATRDPERYFDRRTISRHLKRGLVTEAEHTRYVETLPDATDKIKARDEGGDDDGFDGRGRPKSATPMITATMPDPRTMMSDDDFDDDDDDDFDDDDDDDDDDSSAAAPSLSAAVVSEPVPVVAAPVVAPSVEAEAPAEPVADVDPSSDDLG